MTGPDQDASAAQLLEFDREHLWHPYTSMTEPLQSRLVTGADGVRLRLSDGREVVDAMSSWWCAIHGYRHPALDSDPYVSSWYRIWPSASNSAVWCWPR